MIFSNRAARAANCAETCGCVSLRGVPAALAARRNSLPAIPTAGHKPAFTMDEYCSTFAFAPDNRLAIVVYRIFNHKKYTLEGDDLWISSPDGKRTRIIEGAKIVKTTSRRVSKSMRSLGRRTAKSWPSTRPPSISPAIRTRSLPAI